MQKRLFDVDGIVTQDETSTPNVSPKTAVDSVLTLVPPANAVGLTFQCSVAAKYGDNATLDGSASGKGYKNAKANTDCYVGCANGKPIYILPASSATIDFLFDIKEA